MPVFLAIGLLAAIAVGVASGGNPDTVRKKIGEALKPSSLRGAGGRVVPRAFSSGGASAYPGGVADPPSAPASVLTALSNAVQTPVQSVGSSFSAGPAPADTPTATPSPAPFTTYQTPGSFGGGTDEPGGGNAQTPTTSASAPTVVQVAPTMSAPPQTIEPTYQPPVVGPSASTPGAQSYPFIAGGAPYTAPAPTQSVADWITATSALDPGMYSTPTVYTPTVKAGGGLAYPISEYIVPTPVAYSPPPYVAPGGGGALDPGLYSAPNAGVSVAPAPGGGGSGSTLA